jgi:hypothetical protein
MGKMQSTLLLVKTVYAVTTVHQMVNTALEEKLERIF